MKKNGGDQMDTLKILVVDDESRMRKLVKDFLTKKNFQVLEAGDGEDGRIKSALGIGALLADGLGDTIRVS